MERQAIESSMIKSIGYDENTSTLEIEFKTGAVWQYLDVPGSLWYEFQAVDSKGKFFHKFIVKNFSESRVA